MSFNAGGGSSSISSASDVSLSSPADSQVLGYDGTTAKWKNVSLSASSGGWPGTVALDSFSGANDDAKLEAAFAYVKAQPYMPMILFGNRQYTFTQTHNTFSGMKLSGFPAGFLNAELASSSYVGTKVSVNCGIDGASFLVGTAQNYDIYIGNMAFSSTNQATQWISHPLANGTMYAACFDNLDFMGFKHVMGNPTNPLSVTLNQWRGAWNITTTVDTQITLGGSDNDLFTQGVNIGADATNWPGAGKPLMICNNLGKTNIGPMYFTCDNGWTALSVTGGLTYGPSLHFTGCRFEGRNPSTPSNGAVVLVSGGGITFRDCWFAYGMANPSANGHSPTDAGMIMITGGDVVVDNPTYDRASSVAETVPLLYATSGTVDISHARIATRGGSWTGKPRAHADGGASLVSDASVTLV